MKNIRVVTSASKELATPNDLGDKTCQAVAAVINPLVADAFALYVKTKNYHWHMSGSHYRDYHLLLDEQSEQLFAMIDPLAERVRKLGGLTIHSIEQIKALKRVHDDQQTYVKPNDMLRRLLDDNKQMADNIRTAHAVCDKHGDIATASLLENFLDETERRVWFLFETLSDR